MGRAVYFVQRAGTGYGYVLQTPRLHQDRQRHATRSLPMSSWDASVEGKDVIIIDDMISSGESMLDVAKELKEQQSEKGIHLRDLRSVHQRTGEV